MASAKAIILSCLCLTISAQKFVDPSNRTEATVSVDGPRMVIDLKWTPRFDTCSSQLKYRLELIDEQQERVQVAVDLQSTNFTLLSSYDLFFWKPVEIRIQEKCVRYIEHSNLKIEKLPGEYLPANSAVAKPKPGAAELTWELDERQDPPSHVKISICEKSSGACREPVLVAATESIFTVTDLIEGAQYLAELRLWQNSNGRNYSSKPFELVVESLPPKLDDAELGAPTNLNPKVVNSSATHADVQFTYESSKESQQRLIEIHHMKGGIVRELRTENLTVLFEHLPRFSKLRVFVRAIYPKDENHDYERLSAAAEQPFSTGTGEIAKPEITRLMAISGDKALVEWSVPNDTSPEIDYNIHVSGENETVVKVPGSSRRFYALLENLTPEKEYSVQVKTYFKVNNDVSEDQVFENASETKTLKMLAKGALAAKLEVSSTEPATAILEWSVEMPQDPSHCTFAISVEGSAIDRKIHHKKIRGTDREQNVDFFPFEEQSLTIETHCQYHIDVEVRKVSQAIHFLGEFELFPVVKLSVHSEDPNSLVVDYEPLEEQRPFIAGYMIEYAIEETPPSEQLQAEGTLFRITGLEPATEYKVTVYPHTKHGDMGQMKTAFAFTKPPRPGKVEKLNVEQESFGSPVHITWQPLEYKFGAVNYEVVVTCGEWRGNTTVSAPKADFTIQPAKDKNCLVRVVAVVDVEGQPQMQGDAEYRGFTPKYLEAPISIKCNCRDSSKYDCVIEPPENAKNLDLTYMAEFESEAGLREQFNSSDATIAYVGTPGYSHVTVKAAICHSGTCSEEKVLYFMTNPLAPGPVRDLKVEVEDSTNFRVEWAEPSRPQGPLDGYVVRVVDKEDYNATVALIGRNESRIYLFRSSVEHVEYTITIFAYNLNRCGPPEKLNGTSESTAVLTSGKKPPPPTKIEVEASDTGDSSLSWEPANFMDYDVTKYRVEAVPVLKNGELDIDNKFESITDETSFSSQVLRGFTKFAVGISNCVGDEAKDCGRPRKREILTPPRKPSPPLELTWTKAGDNFINLKWSAPAEPQGPIDGYKVSYAIPNGAGLSWNDQWTSEPMAEIKGLTNGTKYSFAVRAFNYLNSKNETRLISDKTELTVTTTNHGERNNGHGPSAIVVVAVVGFVVLVGAILAFAYLRFRKRPQLSAEPMTFSALQQT